MVKQPQENTEESQPDDSGGTGVLRRLLNARNQGDAEPEYAPQLPVLQRLTPSRAAGIALSRAGNMLYDLPMKAESVDIGGMTLAELPELLPEAGLLAVLQGPGDAMGVMALCMNTVTSLVEIQSLGRVTSRAAPTRRLTKADALLCADFVNTVMDQLTGELSAMKGFDGIGGFRYASYLSDARPLGLILEDKPHRSLSFKLSIGNSNAREATIFLALPSVDLGESENSSKTVKQLASETETRLAIMAPVPTPAAVQATLYDSVQGAPVEVTGILCRRMITLGELRGLKGGSVLSLPRAHLSKVQVELTGGQVLATGKLGEAGGCHAIRLHDTESSEGDATMTTGRSFGQQSADEMPGADFAMGDFSADDASPGDLGVEEFAAAPMIEDMMPVDLSAPDEFREEDASADSGGLEGEEHIFEPQSGAA